MKVITLSMFALLLIGVIVIRELYAPSATQFINQVSLLSSLLEFEENIEETLGS